MKYILFVWVMYILIQQPIFSGNITVRKVWIMWVVIRWQRPQNCWILKLRLWPPHLSIYKFCLWSLRLLEERALSNSWTNGKGAQMLNTKERKVDTQQEQANQIRTMYINTWTSLTWPVFQVQASDSGSKTWKDIWYGTGAEDGLSEKHFQIKTEKCSEQNETEKKNSFLQ